MTNIFLDFANCIIQNPISSLLAFSLVYLVVRYQYDREFRYRCKWAFRDVAGKLESLFGKLYDSLYDSSKKHPKAWFRGYSIGMGIVVSYWTYDMFVNFSHPAYLAMDGLLIGFYGAFLIANMKKHYKQNKVGQLA